MILNGTTYQYRDFTFADKLANYLENEGFLNSTNYFPQTGRYLQAQLYLYTYPVKHIRQWYRANWEYWVSPRAREYGLERIKATQAANIIYKTLLALIPLLSFVLWKLVACICCRTAKKSTPKDEPIQMSSLDDVKRKKTQ